jgi:3,4-dihydroxy 2-butanone 4-phosphate synthase/GTP cyclohydrolase II
VPLTPIPEILEELRAGRIVVLVDDEDRENEGDFVCAAEHVSVEVINFMTRVGGGYLCVAMTASECQRLGLGPQSAVNTSLRGTPFTVSVDGHPRHGVGTGISARDRVKTIRLLNDPRSVAEDFVRPGHINPLHARDGGVLVRTGQTEGSVDLCRLAGLRPTALLIEVVREDGEMARRPDLELLCARHGLKMCSVEQIIEHRLQREALVHRLEPRGGVPLETPHGTFNLIAYSSAVDALPHLALTVGGVGDLDALGEPQVVEDPVLVRVHRRDLLGDIFDERSHPSGEQLRASLRILQSEGRGALVYLRPEGVGDDWRSNLQRIRRAAGMEGGAPDLTSDRGIGARAHPMDQREIGVGGQILRDLGLRRLRVLSNTPRHHPGLPAYGLEIVDWVGIGGGGG